MSWVMLDFETTSACDLKKAGAWRYAEDPSTDIICTGYAIDGASPIVMARKDVAVGARKDVAVGARFGAFVNAVRDPAFTFVAHNCAFEKAIWRNVMVKRYGWPDISNERWRDTMALCAMKSLPLDLAGAGRVLGLSAQKDAEGNRLLHRVIKEPALLEEAGVRGRLAEYNKADVVAQVNLLRRLMPFDRPETEVWQLDQTINERGILIDEPFVRGAQKIVADSIWPLAEEFTGLTGLKPTQRDAFLNWCRDRGALLPNLQAGTLEDAEENPEDYGVEAEVARPLAIRALVSSSSVKKLDRMLACRCADGRVRGTLQYHGATTGRWSGRLLQPQNFPRGSLVEDGSTPDPEAVAAAITSGDAELIRLLYGEPVEVVSSALRHAILAAPGYSLVAGDYAKIECVIVLALAGAPETARRVIEQGSAVYTDMGAKLFGRSITKADVRDYVVAKGVILGSGFQMGWRKFQSHYAPDHDEAFAKAAISEYREHFAPEVPKLWYALEDAAFGVVKTGGPETAYGVTYRMEGEWLTALLPSGRKLWYFQPGIEKKLAPWSAPGAPEYRLGWYYWAKKAGQWRKVSAYGGLLTENVVQALARDLIVCGMRNAEAAALPVVFTVHDEIVAEAKGDFALDEELKQAMELRPKWAIDLGVPVAAECWQGQRYRK